MGVIRNTFAVHILTSEKCLSSNDHQLLDIRPFNLPLVSRGWRDGSNSSYNCTPFLHSLLTKGKLSFRLFRLLRAFLEVLLVATLYSSKKPCVDEFIRELQGTCPRRKQLILREPNIPRYALPLPQFLSGLVGFMECFKTVTASLTWTRGSFCRLFSQGMSVRISRATNIPSVIALNSLTLRPQHTSTLTQPNS